MTGAITLLFVLTISVLLTRFGSVALRQTGLSTQVARFQALSAFTGTGFTTPESESIVNHPLRRRIVALLMIIGNLGLVTVLATVILTFIDARESLGASLAQALWLGAVMVVMWFLVLNRHADRLICGLMGRLLQRSALFESQIVTLLQLPEAHAVAQIQITEDSPLAGQLCSEISGRGLKGTRHHVQRARRRQCPAGRRLAGTDAGVRGRVRDRRRAPRGAGLRLGPVRERTVAARWRLRRRGRRCYRLVAHHVR